jgi:hypothetical protein
MLAGPAPVVLVEDCVAVPIGHVADHSCKKPFLHHACVSDVNKDRTSTAPNPPRSCRDRCREWMEAGITGAVRFAQEYVGRALPMKTS